MGRKRKKRKVEPSQEGNIETSMSPATKITIDRQDGSQEVVTVTPQVAPTDKEVDIMVSDGTVKRFVPAA